MYARAGDAPTLKPLINANENGNNRAIKWLLRKGAKTPRGKWRKLTVGRIPLGVAAAAKSNVVWKWKRIDERIPVDLLAHSGRGYRESWSALKLKLIREGGEKSEGVGKRRRRGGGYRGSAHDRAKARASNERGGGWAGQFPVGAVGKRNSRNYDIIIRESVPF